MIINIVFAVAGWLASIYTIFNTPEVGDSFFEELIIIIAPIIVLAYVFIQVKLYHTANKNVIVSKNKDMVNTYLLKWLKDGGKTIIFTRDLTWADESEDIKNTLISKAQKSELEICLYKKTATTDMLKSLGAEIHTHNLSNELLTSRFTIIDYGTNNPKITVGTKQKNGTIINEQYDKNNNPNVYHVFIELYHLVKGLDGKSDLNSDIA